MADDDFLALVKVLAAVAKDMIEKHGEFRPLAATISSGGQAEMWGVDLGVELPDSSDVVEFLTGALRVRASDGGVRAAGICLNVRARLPGHPDQVDAICCRLEHKGGQAKQIFIPYRKNHFGRIEFDKLVGLPGTLNIFRPSSNTD